MMLKRTAAPLDSLYDEVELNAVALGELAAGHRRWVSTIADLRQVSADVWPGDEVAVLGWKRPGDGGGGVLRFTADRPRVDNGIVLASEGTLGGWARVLRTRAVSVEMVGGVDDRSSGAALQALFDGVAGQGLSAVLAPRRRYVADRALFIRRSGLSLMGNNAEIVLDADEIKGSLITVTNSSDIQIRDLRLDIANRFQNGLTLIGHTQEFAETIALGPPAAVANVSIHNLSVRNTRFHINRREGVILDSPIAASAGAIVDSVDGMGRPVEGTVVAVEMDGHHLIVDWRINQVHVNVRLMARGSRSAAIVIKRFSVPMTEQYSGIVFGSWTGKFGGKGLSIQRACSNILVTGLRTEDCDIGFSLEAHPPAPANGLREVTVTNVDIIRPARAAIWIHSSAGPTEDAMQAMVENVRIEDPCSGGDRMGVISMDRAANVRLLRFTMRRTANQKEPVNYAVIQGLFTRCHIEKMEWSGPAEAAIDFRPHARTGNAPGTLPPWEGANFVGLNLQSARQIRKLAVWNRSWQRPTGSKFRFAADSDLARLRRSIPKDTKAEGVEISLSRLENQRVS